MLAILLAAVPMTALAIEPKEVIALWPGTAPGDGAPKGEEADMTKPGEGLVSGRRVARIGNVSKPTVSFFPAPKGSNTGAAVLVCPGGGYNVLAWDLEGTEVCEWLNRSGVNAALLKYRVPRRDGRAKHDGPLEDAQRAMGLIRRHAEAWAVDPKRIGILGFSAGGHLAATASNQPKRNYAAVDDADALPCRPDFTVLIYPAYLTATDGGLDLAPEVAVGGETPPAFLAMTADDGVHYENAMAYTLALKKAGVPVELHIFPEGGHGYGLRTPGPTVTKWPDLAADWMKARGVLKRGN
jgi:acetyl esterase/lipase